MHLAAFLGGQILREKRFEMKLFSPVLAVAADGGYDNIHNRDLPYKTALESKYT